MRADEAGADEPHSDSFHALLRRSSPSRCGMRDSRSVSTATGLADAYSSATCRDVRMILVAPDGIAVHARLVAGAARRRAARARRGVPAPAPQGRGQASPASVRPPQPATPQSYPREQVDAGRTRFAAQCGFCHGRDAAGGEGGTDLTRSALVAADVRGDSIGPLVRTGRADKGMPAFTLSDADLTAIVAFIHDQKAQADAATGGRRSVDVADLQTGNADGGEALLRRRVRALSFADRRSRGRRRRATRDCRCCSACSIPGRPDAAAIRRRAPPTVTSRCAIGQVVTGTLAYRDEFTIALTDAAGWYRSWPTPQVTFTVDDPLQAHVEQLGKYTDADMHDVLAYLQTLR